MNVLSRYYIFGTNKLLSFVEMNYSWLMFKYKLSLGSKGKSSRLLRNLVPDAQRPNTLEAAHGRFSLANKLAQTRASVPLRYLTTAGALFQPFTSKRSQDQSFFQLKMAISAQ